MAEGSKDSEEGRTGEVTQKRLQETPEVADWKQKVHREVVSTVK